jgi:predicted alpha/beta-fold hydrolase
MKTEKTVNGITLDEYNELLTIKKAHELQQVAVFKEYWNNGQGYVSNDIAKVYTVQEFDRLLISKIMVLQDQLQEYTEKLNEQSRIIHKLEERK